MNFKHKFSLVLTFTLGLLAFSACEIDEVTDPNNPSLGSVLNGASKAELQGLITGLEARHREYFDNATEMFGCFGREVWAFFGSDPRFTVDWLGINITETYPDFFASGGTYVSPYLAVKQANVILDAADNTDVLTAEEANGLSGFAKTIKAYQLLWPLLQQGEKGIRVDVADFNNLGPRVNFDQALTEIRRILDEANGELNQGGSSFFFTLSSGFEGFNTPATFAQVNRAIAARAALYAEDWAAAQAALADSFIDAQVDAGSADKMMVGPQHVYGEAPDINNPLFYPLDRETSTILVVHPAVIEDALPNDGRLAKFAERVENPATNGNLPDLEGRYQDARWATNTSPIPFIRNEELILISAEAEARLGNTGEAVNLINVVRNTWGVGDYTGGTSEDELIDEILFQRRYSLWAEGGHRWVDLRRTGRLNATYVDLRDGGNLFTDVAARTSENF